MNPVYMYGRGLLTWSEFEDEVRDEFRFADLPAAEIEEHVAFVLQQGREAKAERHMARVKDHADVRSGQRTMFTVSGLVE